MNYLPWNQVFEFIIKLQMFSGSSHFFSYHSFHLPDIKKYYFICRYWQDVTKTVSTCPRQVILTCGKWVINLTCWQVKMQEIFFFHIFTVIILYVHNCLFSNVSTIIILHVNLQYDLDVIYYVQMPSSLKFFLRIVFYCFIFCSSIFQVN